MVFAGPWSRMAAQATAPKDQQPGGVSAGQITAIQQQCHYDPAETDVNKKNAASACVLSRVNALLSTQFNLFVGNPSAGPGPSGGSLVNGTHVGGSHYGTPSSCGQGEGFNNPTIVGVRRELLAPKEASDVYGRRLGKRYLVYQVRVTNLSKDFQYIVHDISLDLSPIFNQPPRNLAYLASERDLSMLRGVTEKGQDLDPRNLTLHVLQGIGSVAGGVSGLTDFADTMGPAVAVFNGAFLQGLVGIAPDHTSTQLNRLSDTAFASNAVVDKLHAKVFAVFVPEGLFLDKGEQKQFWKNPKKFLETKKFDQIDVCVDGAMITEVTATTSPTFSPAPSSSGPVTAATVTLANVAPDAAIYYTTNGDDPTTDSPTYTGPIAISGTITIKAMAVSPNHTPSPVVFGTYKNP